MNCQSVQQSVSSTVFQNNSNPNQNFEQLPQAPQNPVAAPKTTDIALEPVDSLDTTAPSDGAKTVVQAAPVQTNLPIAQVKEPRVDPACECDEKPKNWFGKVKDFFFKVLDFLKRIGAVLLPFIQRLFSPLTPIVRILFQAIGAIFGIGVDSGQGVSSAPTRPRPTPADLTAHRQPSTPIVATPASPSVARGPVLEAPRG